MAMRTDCPKDGHGRFLVGRRAGLLVRREGVLAEDCHRVLSEQERKDWTGPT